MEQAATRWHARRVAWFERVELEVDKQNKHIKGTRNYIKVHSEWTHPNPRDKLKQIAGKGQKIVGEPGMPGYRERVDCGEIIGYFTDGSSEPVPTSMAIIHYSKKGAHIVPAAPKK